MYLLRLFPDFLYISVCMWKCLVSSSLIEKVFSRSFDLLPLKKNFFFKTSVLICISRATVFQNKNDPQFDPLPVYVNLYCSNFLVPINHRVKKILILTKASLWFCNVFSLYLAPSLLNHSFHPQARSFSSTYDRLSTIFSLKKKQKERKEKPHLTS